MKKDECLHLLTEKVVKNVAGENNIGLINGLSGQLLFLIYAECNLPNSINNEFLQQQLFRLQTNLKEQVFSHHSLTYGLSGIGLCFELIQQLLGNDENINEEIDLRLLSIIKDYPKTGEYELLQGVAGIVLYALQRLQYSTGEQLLDRSLDLLLNLKVNVGDLGVVWPTNNQSPFRFKTDDTLEFNLGLAHGNFGVLGVLNKVYQQRPTSYLKGIIEQHSQWLVQQGAFTDQVNYFGYCCDDNKTSRLAWCYGDLSNALVLWHAGKITKNETIMAVAKKIAKLAATRRLENSGVTDAGLCHGFSGNAVIFQTLYNEMQDKMLKEASDYWYSLLHKALSSGDDLKALWRFNPVNNEYEECFGLLEGYAGIGLALLSQFGFNNDWQTCLLMD